MSPNPLSSFLSLFSGQCQWSALMSLLQRIHSHLGSHLFSSCPPLILLTITSCCPSYRLWPTTLLLLLFCHSAFLHSTTITSEPRKAIKDCEALGNQGPHSWSLKCLKWQWRQSHLGGKMKQQQPRNISQTFTSEHSVVLLVIIVFFQPHIWNFTNPLKAEWSHQHLLSELLWAKVEKLLCRIGLFIYIPGQIPSTDYERSHDHSDHFHSSHMFHALDAAFISPDVRGCWTMKAFMIQSNE